MTDYKEGEFLTSAEGPYLTIPAGTLVKITDPAYGDDQANNRTFTIELSQDYVVMTPSPKDKIMGKIVNIEGF